MEFEGFTCRACELDSLAFQDVRFCPNRCGSILCLSCEATRVGVYGDRAVCRACDPNQVSTQQLLNYLLWKCGLTRAEAEAQALSSSVDPRKRKRP